MANQYFKDPIGNTSRWAVATIAVVLLCTAVGCETTPPVQEMSDARQAIAVAKKAGAAELAAIHLSAAEQYLSSAQTKLNEHAYNQARSDAKQAKVKALDALKVSTEFEAR